MKFRNMIIAALLFVQPVNAASVSSGVEVSSMPYDDATFNVMKVPPGKMKFTVQRGRPDDADFYINSNFFHKGGKQIGEIVIDGSTQNPPVRGGSYFFVRDGAPGVSAYDHPENAEYSTQSVISVINDGVPNKTLYRMNHAKFKTSRSVIGQDEAGNTYVISTSLTSKVSIEQITEFAVRLGIVEAMVPDGGTSVDYKLSNGKSSVEVKVMPHFLKQYLDIDEPQVYIVGNLLRD